MNSLSKLVILSLAGSAGLLSAQCIWDEVSPSVNDNGTGATLIRVHRRGDVNNYDLYPRKA